MMTGMLNIHGSLLPRWRGAAPVNYAVLNDDETTGITIMKIAPKKYEFNEFEPKSEEFLRILLIRFDVGDIVLQIEHKIRHRITAKQLKAELAPIGAHLVNNILDKRFNKFLIFIYFSLVMEMSLRFRQLY